IPTRQWSSSVTSTAPTRRSRMAWHASLTVALGGRVTGSWFLTISDIFLMDQGLCWRNLSDVGFRQVRCSVGFLCDIDRLQFDQRSMNFPVTDTFQLRKLLLCCFDRPFSTGSRSDHDRALAAPKKSLVSRYFID